MTARPNHFGTAAGGGSNVNDTARIKNSSRAACEDAAAVGEIKAVETAADVGETD